MICRLLLALILCLATMPRSPNAAPSMAILAEVGPWPVVSRLIGFDSRLWFANSVKGRNHNSADLYSLDLANDDVRYERHLFSQDAGRPVVVDDRLYWPFEDARFSMGLGHFMVTDGERWQEGLIPTGRIFHNHAMAQMTGTGQLVAATSAWRAHLDFSSDFGASWRQAYDHPTPERRVSRIVDLATLGDRVFGTLVSRDERGLLQFEGGTMQPVPGWPTNSAASALTAYRGWIYGLVQMGDGRAIWRTDGERSERVISEDGLGVDQTDNGIARDLVADDQGLWLLTTGETDGKVWKSGDGREWAEQYAFSGGSAFELQRYRGRIFVGGTDRERGVGLLWGSLSNDDVVTNDHRASREKGWLLPPGETAGDRDWAAAGVHLERLLATPSTYLDHARDLRGTVLDLLTEDPPPGFFSERLTAPMAEEPMSMIGGAVQIPASLMGQSLLLFGIALQGEKALAGSASIPLGFFRTPWTRQANRAEKYFDTLPFALWAIGNAGQRDRLTIETLIERLANDDDPLWIKGDVIGALTALTDQRHAYDIEAWQSWWAKARSTWPAP